MADEQITSNTANIPYVNFTNVGSDQAAPASGRAILYIKNGVAYVRLDTGSPTPVGGAVALAEGRLAVGDGSGELSALALGTEGQVVTADASGFATWDDAPAGGGPFVGVRYTSNTGQNVVNNTAGAIVNFEDVDYDSGGGTPLVTTGASWKFTAPSTGYYHVDVRVTFNTSSGWNIGERGLLHLYVDGSPVAIIDRQDDNGNGATGSYMSLQGSATIDLAAASYLDIRIQQNSGGDIALLNDGAANWINVEKVG